MVIKDAVTGQKISGVWVDIDVFSGYGKCYYCGVEEDRQCIGELEDGTTIEIATKVHLGRESV